MEIKNVLPKPYEKSIFPGISFDVEISYTKYEKAIIGISGWLETDDKKIIAEIKEEVSERQEYSEIRARGTHLDKEFKEVVYRTTLVALLDRTALNHIEKRRMKNRKGNVKLTINLNVKTIDSRAVISHLYEIEPTKLGLKPIEVNIEGTRSRNWGLLIYTYTPEYYSHRINKWILSGNSGPVFLAIFEQPLKKEITISSTDWIYDYAPKFGLGEYFIVEIPKGEGIIEEAWKYVEKAEECFRRWDIKGIYANCREAGHLLNGIVKEKFGKDNFNYKERWGRTYSRFEHLLSLGLHLEQLKQGQQYPAECVKISKSDAEHVLMVTKLLIKYAEELLKEK